MFNNPLMSDISFTCGESDKKFNAHKYVLAISSSVFYAMWLKTFYDFRITTISDLSRILINFE